MRRLSREFEEYPDYFCYLCEMVCIDGRYTDQAYWVLAKTLWDTDFTWSLDMDADRAANGMALRKRYYEEGGTDGYDGPCTVLEVLVALADRMAAIFDELDGECKTPMFFWEMIENLELENYSDMAFEDYPARVHGFFNRMDRRIERWLDRRFEPDGRGSPFPLRRPRQDQREVDLWYQANAYMTENYL